MSSKVITKNTKFLQMDLHFRNPHCYNFNTTVLKNLNSTTPFFWQSVLVAVYIYSNRKTISTFFIDSNSINSVKRISSLLSISHMLKNNNNELLSVQLKLHQQGFMYKAQFSPDFCNQVFEYYFSPREG